MSKWYDVCMSGNSINIRETGNDCLSKATYTIKWQNYKDSCTRKTMYFDLCLYKNGKETPLEINGWKLSRHITSELRKWHSGIGKHSFFEINITSLAEGDKTFRFYAEYGEQELLNSIIKTLCIILMCNNSNEFDRIFGILKNKENIYDWRTKLSAEMSLKLIHSIKNAEINLNILFEKR